MGADAEQDFSFSNSVNADDKIVLGSDGTSAAIKLIRDNGGQTVTAAFALDWSGWSGIDGLNRIFEQEWIRSA